MDAERVEDIYCTLIGVMQEEFCVSDVENLFTEGSECETLYSKMLAAYARLRKRLGVEDEDRDVEEIINSLLAIERTVGMKMFEYGMKFAKEDT